ncbi:MAG: LUD domain-containing protein [Acidobacteriaceae bacterium]|nr:LUD domain-containing protein [Acidobacteriaceae bacterium]
MSIAKQVILTRIRDALARSPQITYESCPREYRRASALDVRSRIELFEDRLRDYGSRVYHCSSDQIADSIALAMRNAGKTALVIPDGFPRTWLPDECTFTLDNGLSYQALDGAEGVLTGCAAAIAETGTIVLRHSGADGRRALTLLPDYHLCVVRQSQIVASVPEGIQAATEFATSPITTISGPSATSDIEMTRVKGVHGPRTLDVIITEP